MITTTYDIQPAIINNSKQNFETYLDSLDPEIYNSSITEYGRHFNLKYFSDLFTSDILSEIQEQQLDTLIKLFKIVVKEVVQNKIIQLSKYLND